MGFWYTAMDYGAVMTNWYYSDGLLGGESGTWESPCPSALGEGGTPHARIEVREEPTIREIQKE